MNQTLFQLCVVVGGAWLTAGAALLYFTHVRLERPAIGHFNGRDVLVVFVFLVTLPALYVILPEAVLTAFLILTFVSALTIGYRPLLSSTPRWLIIGALLGANIAVTRVGLGTVRGWQIYWTLTSIVVLLAVVAVANLYVQGGMQLRHVAWFALALAVYDPLFSIVIPLSIELADRFAGFALDPSIGMRLGALNANIGMGDLLVYSLFTIAAYKAYGPRTLPAVALAITVFGCVIPSIAPELLGSLHRGNIGFVVPAQTFFGPVAFLLYLWWRRRGVEAPMSEWLNRATPAETLPASSKTAELVQAVLP